MSVPRVKATYVPRPSQKGEVGHKSFQVCRTPYRKYLRDAIEEGSQAAAGQLFAEGLRSMYQQQQDGSYKNIHGGQDLSGAQYTRLMRAAQQGTLTAEDIDEQCVGIAEKKARGPLPAREKAHVEAYRKVRDLMKEAVSAQTQMGYPVGKYKGRGAYPPAVFQQKQQGTDEYGNPLWVPVGTRQQGESGGPCPCPAEGLHCSQGLCIVPQYRVTMSDGQTIDGDLAKAGQTANDLVLVSDGQTYRLNRSEIVGMQSLRKCPPDSFGFIIMTVDGKQYSLVPPSGRRVKLAKRYTSSAKSGPLYVETCIGGVMDAYGRVIPIYPPAIAEYLGLQTNYELNTQLFDDLQQRGLSPVVSRITGEPFIYYVRNGQGVRIYKDNARPSPFLTKHAVNRLFEREHGMTPEQYFQQWLQQQAPSQTEGILISTGEEQPSLPTTRKRPAALDPDIEALSQAVATRQARAGLFDPFAAEQGTTQMGPGLFDPFAQSQRVQ